MPDQVTCPACQQAMQPGFVPTSKGGASMFAASWHPGAPDTDKSFWEKFRSGAGGANVDDESLVPIVTYRCSQCGLLSFYAPKE